MGTVTRKSVWGLLLLLGGCGGFSLVEPEGEVASEPIEVLARPGGVPTVPESDETPGDNGAADENSEDGTNPDSEGGSDGEESNQDTEPSDDGVGEDSGSGDGADDGTDEATDSGTEEEEDGSTDDEEEGGCEPVPSFTLTDINPSSETLDETLSPSQFEGEVSVWYFMHTS